jgi:hypothetical protein
MACILVTGGAGFLGSHLVDALVQDGHAVRVLDDLSSGTRENLPRQIEFIYGDVTDPAAVERAFDGIEACFHLAAIAAVVRSSCEWRRTHEVNLTGTINIFEQARRLRDRQESPDRPCFDGGCLRRLQQCSDKRAASGGATERLWGRQACLRAPCADRWFGSWHTDGRFALQPIWPPTGSKLTLLRCHCDICRQIGSRRASGDFWRRAAGPRLYLCWRCGFRPRSGVAGCEHQRLDI